MSMNTLWQDVRFGIRMLAKNPGFTAIAVLTLALGIGANTAIFSIVNGVLLKPLPYTHPEKIVNVWGRFTGIGLPDDRNWVSAPEFRDLQELSQSFSSLAAMTTASFNISGGARPERVEGAVVSPSFFTVLGLKPAAGRLFADREAQPGHDQELLLAYGLWERRFGRDPSVVGRKLEVNGKEMVIVGVMPEGFDYPEDAEMWQPLAFTNDDLSPDNRGSHGYEVIARIKPDLTLVQAREDMDRVTHSIIERNASYPYKKFNYAVLLVPLLEQTVGDVQTALWVLCGAVGVVLLIACVNVASLLLARASARQKEIAIRVSLGAGRWRIARQMLTESLLLSSMGGLAGLLVAPYAMRGIIQLGNVALPRIASVKMDGWVLLFTLVISLGTGLLFGLAPALQVLHASPNEDLKDGGRSGSEGGSAGKLRRVLVVCETALSVILLVGAGLLMRSFLQVLAVDPGFHADTVLTMRVSLPGTKYSQPDQVRNFFRDVLQRIDKLPGVEAAGATVALPLSGLGGSGTTTVDTQAVPVDKRTPEITWRPVTVDYFKAMGIPVLRGRAFNEFDSEHSQPVVIVDDTFAQAFFPNQDPIGKRLHLGGLQSTRPWMTIVGEVSHVHYLALGSPLRPQLYWPEMQNPYSTMSLAIRTSVDPLSLTSAVEQQILSVDPDQPVYQVRSMEQLRSIWLSERFLALLLVGLFAGLALILAAVGIYGVMAYTVARRTREIGVHIALGAAAKDVMGMILRQGSILTGIGLAVGILGAFGLTRLMSTMLYGVSTVDPLAYIAGAVVLFAVSLAACCIPARRATKVDPLVALRYE